MIHCRYYHDNRLSRCEHQAELILISGCNNQHVEDRPMCRDHYLVWEGYTINSITKCLTCQDLIQDWEILPINQAGPRWIKTEEFIQKPYWQITGQ